MPKPNPNVLLRHAGNYLKEHPEEILRALRGALGLRLGVPIDAFRYLARELLEGEKAPKDVVIEAVPPGLKVSMTVNAMGTPLRVSFVAYIEEIDLHPELIWIGLRIAELTLHVLGDSSSPLAGLLKSGALDLSKPGNLVAFMPKRPAVLAEAKDDRIALDLMKHPKIAQHPAVLRALRVLTPVLRIQAIRTKDDHLDVHLRATPSGVSAAIAAARTDL